MARVKVRDLMVGNILEVKGRYVYNWLSRLILNVSPIHLYRIEVLSIDGIGDRVFTEEHGWISEEYLRPVRVTEEILIELEQSQEAGNPAIKAARFLLEKDMCPPVHVVQNNMNVKNLFL